MNLLDKIKSEPLYEAPTGWVKYKEAYFILIDEKQYPKRKAIEYIAKEEQS